MDGSAPTTDISSTGTNGWNGWRVSPVEVTLWPSDTRSGVAATYYIVDGGPTHTYAGPFTVYPDGQHQISFWSVDNVGNTEVQKSSTVKIDLEGPTIESAVSGPIGGNNYFTGPAQVSLTVTDDVSGLAYTDFQIDDGPTTAYYSAFSVTGEGTHLVKFWSTDMAGNVSAVSTTVIKIDSIVPSTQATLSGTAGANGWNLGAVQVSLSAADNLSGVQTTYYKVDGGTTKTYTGAFNVSGNDLHTVNFWSVDKATNTETTRSVAVNIDPNTPNVTANASPASAPKSSNPVTVTVSGHVTDTISGAASATYSVVDEYCVTQPSGSVVLQANGNYSFTLSLPATRNVGDFDGHKYTITVRGYDQAGNMAS
ncbi:MAG TPA: hypothetical protein VGN90_12960, partial [Pyrinomonadaceae bacterium]|nr:hypothetical protein [Pyrinomonadaceae bacterium]